MIYHRSGTNGAQVNLPSSTSSHPSLRTLPTMDTDEPMGGIYPATGTSIKHILHTLKMEVAQIMSVNHVDLSTVPNQAHPTDLVSIGPRI